MNRCNRAGVHKDVIILGAGGFIGSHLVKKISTDRSYFYEPDKWKE